MTKSLIAVVLFAISFPLGCSGEDAPPDPLARREGFCKSWAQSACQQSVVDACNSSSIDDCVETQSDFCLGILPENYDSKRASQCLTAVKAAYKDANLTAEELQIVLRLAAPCDQLSKGSSGPGDACAANDDCNTAGGYACIIKLGAAEGICEEPVVVAPGEACDGAAQICEPGYFCTGDNCVAYRNTGRACQGDYECKPEDRCVVALEGEPGECTARLALNEVCSADDECQSHYCVIESGATEGECASMIRLSRSEPLCDNLQ